MPSRTFLNLKEEKKERIEQALIHEFGKGSFEQASITNIINEAKIPRGSFYQYFVDKKDAVQYLIEKFITIDHEKMYQSLLESKGDIFETALKVYDYRTDEKILNFDIGLARNILEELRKNNTCYKQVLFSYLRIFSFFFSYYFFSTIISTIFTNSMWHYWFMTTWTSC